MRRREFLFGVAAVSAEGQITIPLRQVFDRRAMYLRDPLNRFKAEIWPEAIREFDKCGIRFSTRSCTGEIRRSPSGKPIFTELDRSALNLVVTDLVPMSWDRARGLAGVTTSYEGYQLCVIALQYAHSNQIPFLSVNTCVHEILHALMQDIFEARPSGFDGEAREVRIDAYATRLWLFHDSATIRQSAALYLSRMRSAIRPSARWTVAPGLPTRPA